MSSKIQNENNLKFFTTDLCCVHYNGKKELEFWDRIKIIVAFIIGFFFAGIGSPIAGLTASYILRKRKIVALKKEQVQETSRIQRQLTKRKRSMLESTQGAIESQESKYKLNRVPGLQEKRGEFGDPIQPITPNSHKEYHVAYLAKNKNELLSPTVKAAYWRRSTLYL